ncbi:energy transducer TonB [Halioxenophilus aromaticivorans]|uniref:Protein TonB n=1 Tax=Halioxenophilus aromaticivorans TaxID=1306992 RepID=A0AAV3U072_9ALTE
MSTLTAQFSPLEASKYALSLPLAGALTMALFIGMYLLIAREYELPDEKPPIKIAEIVLPKPAPIETTIEPPRKIKTSPPPTVDRQVTPQSLPQGTGMNLTKPTVTPPNNETITFNNSMLVKQVMVPPVYPRRALAAGTQGYVDVQFVVTAIGTTKNIRVVAADPENVFERSAIKAVEGWRYRPMSEDGQPVESHVVTERIRFTIDQ